MVATPASKRLSQQAVAAFDAAGFYVARGLLSADEVTRIREAFMAANANGPVPGLSDGSAFSDDVAAHDPLKFYPRMMHPHLHPETEVGQIAMRYMLDDRFHPILRDLFGDEPLGVQTMFYFKPPGARGQSLHQDNFYLRVKPGTCMAAWIAIDDADEENGGMMVVPGTRNMPIVCPERADPTTSFTTEYVAPPPGTKAEIVPLKAGDVLFFNGSLIHGSAPNTSAMRFRRSLICHYVPARSAELSTWYTSPMRFDGSTVALAPASGGGPCGTTDAVGAPH